MRPYALVLDEQGNDTKLKVDWAEVHGPKSKKELFCATSHVWIYNSEGQVLLQKRGPNMSTYPNRWDISAAGHIDFGESPEHAAMRETKEEIGLDVITDQLEFIINRKASTLIVPGNWTHDEYAWVYLLKSDEPIEFFTRQKSEVDGLKWVDLYVFNRDVHDKELNKKYVPHGEYYDLVIKEISQRI